MSTPDISGCLGRTVRRSMAGACGCTARLWRIVVERDVAGVAIHAEVRQPWFARLQLRSR